MIHHRTPAFAIVGAVAVAIAASTLAGCVRTTQVPIPTLAMPAAPPAGAGALAVPAGSGTAPPPRCLVVLLPGRWDTMDDFAAAGFDAAVRERDLRVDLLAADAHLGYYEERTLEARLLADVFEPVRRRYDRIWLAGTSLGGLGSLVMARDHAGELAGLILLAPFVGEDWMIDELTRAGGVRSWSPPGPIASDDFQRQLWMMLWDWATHGPPIPVWLGSGADDPYAPSHRLLATVLSPERVIVVPGGHDWDTWSRLWRRYLATGELDVCGRGTATAAHSP